MPGEVAAGCRVRDTMRHVSPGAGGLMTICHLCVPAPPL